MRRRGVALVARGVAVGLALVSHLLLSFGLPLPTPGGWRSSCCQGQCGCPAEERRLDTCCCSKAEKPAPAAETPACCSTSHSCCSEPAPGPPPVSVRWVVPGLFAARCKGVSPAGLYMPDPSPPPGPADDAPSLPTPEGFLRDVASPAVVCILPPPSPPPRHA